jgi:hypothetical protein
MDANAKAATDAVITTARIAADQTFVFENVEVKKTGRKATNKLRSGKVDELIEVTPTESSVGSWKKWVREDTLFKVEQ